MKTFNIVTGAVADPFKAKNDGHLTIHEANEINEYHHFSKHWEDRHDWKSLEAAEAVAATANEAAGYRKYLAIDSGPWTSPRYDIIEMPQVGDFVSYSFNGDSYPDGTIVSISKTLKVVTTDTGSKYYRRKLTGAWKKHKTWTMVRGYRDERNPHF